MLLLYIILATIFVSLISVVAIFLFFGTQLKNKLDNLISLSAGVLLSVAFLDLLPEAAAGGLVIEQLALMIFGTILVLFFVETFFHWHHCRHGGCVEEKHHHLAWFSLFGDGLHNFVDGVVIASAFLIDIKLGCVTTLAVVIHEVPQEVSDVGVLVYAGFNKAKALMFNFVFALSAVAGGLLTYFFASSLQILPYLLAVAAGNFIYLSLTDLVPLIHQEKESKKIRHQMLWFFVGVIGITILIRFSNI
ncbi:MAG TPA: ZIP family metal transporter [bacterium]|nr:ZIP family metal transporter [bacterium]